MKSSILFSIVFSVLLLQDAGAQDLKRTEELGDHYFQSGQISEALYTYQRAVFFSPETSDAELLLKIANCFEINSDFDRSVEYFDHAYFAENSDSLKLEILFRKAAAFIKTQNYHFALIELLGIDTEEGSLNDQRKSLYLATSYYGLENYPLSRDYFIKSVPEQNGNAIEQIEQIFSRKRNFSKPNPKLAMWLSVFLPGTGQFYAGDWVAGVNSLLLSGTLVGLTFYMTSLYHPIDAILTVLPWFQRYYQGGFGQAEQLAELKRSRNRNIKYQEILDIIEEANN